jgi:tripartite ATP-independent transporter DctP family solute receptor
MKRMAMLHRKVALVAIVGAAWVMTGCGAGARGFDLRLGHDQVDGHPYDVAADTFAARVTRATAGAVTIRVYPAAQLGDSPEQIEGLHLGTLDLALAAFSHASQFCPELGLFGAPFLFENDAHFAAIFDGDVGAALERACVERYAIRLLSTLTSGYRVLFNGRRSVESAADLRDLKIRVMGGEADALTWQAFGAIPVPLPYSEVYSALQAGVIDGAENEAVSILSNRFYEAARYVARTNHLVLPMGLFISEQTLERIPAELRDVLRTQARETAVWERALMVERNADAIAEMQQRFGVQVSGLDPAVLREHATRVQDAVARDLGLQDLLAQVRTAGGAGR